MPWIPTEKRPRIRPKKRWMEVIEKGLKCIGVNNLRMIIHNRKKWREVVFAEKTLVDDIKPEEEEEVHFYNKNNNNTTCSFEYFGYVFCLLL